MTVQVVVMLTTPREPLRAEMHEAFDQAMTETDPFRQRFYAGLGLGYAIAFGLVTRDALDKARTTPYATNLHLDFWRPSSFADEDSAWATGVRRGYWLGTSELPAADECLLCGERLIEPLDDIEYCEDGAFCGLEGCKRLWHANGPHACTPDETEEDR